MRDEYIYKYVENEYYNIPRATDFLNNLFIHKIVFNCMRDSVFSKNHKLISWHIISHLIFNIMVTKGGDAAILATAANSLIFH